MSTPKLIINDAERRLVVTQSVDRLVINLTSTECGQPASRANIPNPTGDVLIRQYWHSNFPQWFAFTDGMSEEVRKKRIAQLQELRCKLERRHVQVY